MICKLLTLALVQCLAWDETVLSLGDSYTIGEGVPAEQRWPVQMVQELQTQGRTLTAPQIIAKTGWTTDQLQAAIQEQELAPRYDWVTLLIGVNNQYRGRDLEQYRQQFRELLELAIEKAGGNPRRVIVLSIPDWGVTPFATARGRDPAVIAAQIDQFNRVNREETEARQAHYVDITPLTRQVADRPEQFLVADQLHPSGEMYRQWAARAAAVIFAEDRVQAGHPPAHQLQPAPATPRATDACDCGVATNPQSTPACGVRPRLGWRIRLRNRLQIQHDFNSDRLQNQYGS
jgi:lysophospholipase L1-like esterase